MKPNLLLLVGWLAPLLALGQDPYGNVPRYDQVPGYRKSTVPTETPVLVRPVMRSVILKINPFMLLGPDGAVHGAVEVPVSAHSAVQGEVGYGAYRSLMNFDSEAYSRKENWRARMQYRWYTRTTTGVDHRFLYLAVEGTYKQVNAIDNQTLGRDCVSGNCGYFQLVQQPVTRYVVGAYGKGGILIPITRSDGTYRLLLDLYAGVGASVGWVVRQPLSSGPIAPTDYLFSPYPRLFTLSDRFSRSTETARVVPDIQLGFTLGYRLGE